MTKTHHYPVVVEWTGNTGTGTSGYRNYERRHEISAGTQKPLIPGSSDPAFRGDAAPRNIRRNPEAPDTGFLRSGISWRCGALESRGIAGCFLIRMPPALVSPFVRGRGDCCPCLH